MAKDRARDIKRSVGSHQKMMGALGNAVNMRRLDDDKKGTGKVRLVSEASPKYTVTRTDEGEDINFLSKQESFIPGEGHVKVNNRKVGYQGISEDLYPDYKPGK